MKSKNKIKNREITRRKVLRPKINEQTHDVKGDDSKINQHPPGLTKPAVYLASRHAASYFSSLGEWRRPANLFKIKKVFGRWSTASDLHII